ncbi:HAD-IIA family hydrolase [Rhodococcus sp. D2-41]|uniref:HAD-IIA family hydrolase n=1 Tax=Speluncibacter jeojiensis TaxID=2710754 RepID=A0A9X4M334_9ACTN|nr:HAD-IIA family hydrolase [Rhodococcus sp. D2-41]MDG3009994.1 HAD-IIA family hydrolase [Rhodococcus sp. D2-41]MDG3016301.1 HAD-IIA family hydrolase [Corynebacteriales bacterium D3-21]
MARIDGVVFDIDGVLTTSGRAIAGADRAVETVRERGLRRVFLTNTTSRSRADIAAMLAGCGIPVTPDEIVTAARLTAEYLRGNHPGARCLLLNSGDIGDDLGSVETVEDGARPDVVVLGGAGPEFTHLALSRVVALMLDGVPVVAMHRGLTWATADGLRIDTGVYLPGMEQAANTKITAVGKPSAAGFVTAAASIGVSPHRLVMIGDDLHSDVLAAQRVGYTGVLVRTGKFRQQTLARAGVAPDHVIDSVADLPTLLESLAG